MADELAIILESLADEHIDDVLAIEHADQAIDFGNFAQELRLVPLHQTPRDDHPLALPVFLELDRIANGSERLGFRRFEESASVDDDGVGARGVVRDRQPVVGEQSEHALAVHEVLRTAEADERDRTNGGRTLGHVGRKLTLRLG